MKLQKVFCIYDSKAEAHAAPFTGPATKWGLRQFEDLSHDPKSQVAKYPADFTLFEIGTFDEDTGLIESYAAKINLGDALTLRSQSAAASFSPNVSN